MKLCCYQYINICFTMVLLHFLKSICKDFCTFFDNILWPTCVFTLSKNRFMSRFCQLICSLTFFEVRWCGTLVRDKQVSVTGEGICTKYWLTNLTASRRLAMCCLVTDHPETAWMYLKLIYPISWSVLQISSKNVISYGALDPKVIPWCKWVIAIVQIAL